MKATGEIFSLRDKEKAPKRKDIDDIETFRPKDCCRTELWRAL